MKRALQAASAQPQQADSHAHVAGQSREIALSAKTYLTPAEAATYLGLTVKALQRRMERRTIPVWTWTRLGSQSRRFVRASLDEWLGQRHTGRSVARTSAVQQSNSIGPRTGIAGGR